MTGARSLTGLGKHIRRWGYKTPFSYNLVRMYTAKVLTELLFYILCALFIQHEQQLVIYLRLDN